MQFLQALLFVFSAPVTLATAIATLMVANIATTISEQQSDRDLSARIQERADRINDLYTSLSVAMSSVIRSSAGILHLGDELEAMCRGKEPTPALGSRIDSFTHSLDDLDRALHEVQVHPAANQLLKTDESTSAVAWLTTRTEPQISWVKAYPANDWTSFRQFIRASSSALRHDPVQPIRDAYRTMLRDGGETEDGKGAFGPLEWTAFAGDLIHVSEKSAKEGGGHAVSLGLAMLHDLFYGLPDAKAIKCHLNASLGATESAVVLDFDRDEMLGTQFRAGMDELHCRRDLLFMETSD